jgi:hypothetical protein
MKKLLPFLLLALSSLPGEDLPDFKIGDVLVLPDGFIALKIENGSSRDLILPPSCRERVFLSLAINGVKRAEYRFKSIDPIIFLQSSFIVFKTNFRIGNPLKLRVELNGEKAVLESDFNNNVLEKELRPQH